MKIILFGKQKISEYILPNKIFGTFRFEQVENDESSLINIEAQDGFWVLKSTIKTKIFDSSGNNVLCQKLEENTFYFLEYDNVKYLMYVEDVLDLSFVKYKYNNNLKIIFGKTNNASLYYDCSVVDGDIFSISYLNNQLTLECNNKNINIYVNKQRVKSDDLKYNIVYGDLIEGYGIKIMILNSIILINNPNNKLFVKDLSAGLEKLEFADSEPLKAYEINDRNLYNDNDYFSKSPRIRRVIQNKTIKIENPPNIEEGNNDIPLLYKLGPMLSMGIYSVVNLINIFIRISSGETTMKNSWTTLITSIAMLCSCFLWPRLTENFTKKQKQKKNKTSKNKYMEYLKNKEKELQEEAKLQKEILEENLISNVDCYNIIINKKIGMWSRRIEQDDFLKVRIGVGEFPLNVEINYPEEVFSVEEDLLTKEAQNVGKSFMKLNNVPIGYSFLDRKITAVMGNEYKVGKFVENIIMQLVTFHSYEDLKIVFITSKKNEKNWEFIKYLPHSFEDSKQLRFFSSNFDEAKVISNYLEEVYNVRKNSDSNSEIKPYFIIITDNYTVLQKTNMLKFATENDDYGFRLLILENKLSNLPSKCNNFISLNNGVSSLIEDAYENQKVINFTDQVVYNINMNDIAKQLLNVPIRLEGRKKMLPETITFLEMENVGQVEQLNIINRWKNNDPTISLKAEIGVDDNNDILYLDVHEKYHGPHGLIAGMTGSGKSELIISFVLSMAINYSPSDVAFVLIDYKGGGLAGAFENKSTGFRLPHLAGTITNLDKAELGRTLVSIESELRRRQIAFNEVRDRLGESTIDIYKYQKYYKEKKIDVAIPHLIIICDEFAELKSQQPEFMDDLISIARIGRSLGVHLILATQKPSGVVNDQIWSNSKFRICLKVQEKSDSDEMLKRPEAALIKQVGRFYLQVGYDELFTLGQSAWCGAKYYPSDKVRKHVDKSINFINNVGNIYKSVEAMSEKKEISNGEEIGNILKHIVDAAKIENVFTNKLWLDIIPDIIYVDNLIKKYNVNFHKFIIDAVIGEYDDPNNQRQDILKINLNNDGNMIILGSDGSDREMALDSIIYSTISRHNTDEINYYIIDYGSESLSKFSGFPHMGDIVLNGDNEKLVNLFKMIDDTIAERKKILSSYGGQYNNYIKQGGQLPQIGVIINNFDYFVENNQMVDDTLIRLARDGKRYGIFLIITANGVNSIRMKLQQNFDTILALRLNDYSDFSMVVGRSNVIPMDVSGRGLFKGDNVYEFQTATIYPEEQLSNYFNQIINRMQELNYKRARRIPVLPDVVTLEYVNNEAYNLSNVPIGIYNDTLNTVKYNFMYNKFNLITGERQENTLLFSKALVAQLSDIKNCQLLIVDVNKELSSIKDNIKHYFYDNPSDIMSLLTAYVSKFKEKVTSDNKVIIYFQNINAFIKVVGEMSISKFFNEIKNLENIHIIIVNEIKEFKSFPLRNFMNISSAIWIGKGVENQTLFMISNRLRNLSDIKTNNYGFVIDNNVASLFKAIELDNGVGEEDDK